MRQRPQAMGRRQRMFIFGLMMGGGLLALLGLTVLLILQSFNAVPHTEGASLVDDVTVAQFAALPGDDAYPASVAAAPDGTVYTGSYVTGALWRIDDKGTAVEIPNSRDTLGAVAGLTVAPDGTLYIVDRLKPDMGARGGTIMQLIHDGTFSQFAAMSEGDSDVYPNDIALDSQSRVYVSDGFSAVWRFNADGSDGQRWWTSPMVTGAKLYAPTGLAYDAANDALLVTDPEVNAIYRVAIADQKTETLYLHGDKPDAPGFDGITVTRTGAIYVAADGLNRIAQLDDGALKYIAGGFRAGSDVDAYTAPDGTLRLYVANWDKFGYFVKAYQPRLPFALDVIQFKVVVS